VTKVLLLSVPLQCGLLLLLAW